MTDLLIIILILTIAYTAYELQVYGRRNMIPAATPLGTTSVTSADNRYLISDAPLFSPQQHPESSQSPRPESDEDLEARTVELIGREAYQKMTERIEDILERHYLQSCVTLRLTCGPDTPEASHALHRLLPGQPIELIYCREDSVLWVDAYSEGLRIGRFTLGETDTLNALLTNNCITGVYVAEQNSYLIPEKIQLGLIAFYVSRPDEEEALPAHPENSVPEDLLQKISVN